MDFSIYAGLLILISIILIDSQPNSSNIELMAIGLLFSGQGAQAVGMGKSLYENSDLVKNIYDSANDILGWDLKEVSFNGPESELTQTKICQPALYVHGYSIYRLLEEKNLISSCEVAFGLSLGELTSLAASGVYDFKTGLKLVAERGRLMQEACDSTIGSMASFIGGTIDLIHELCDEYDIEIANFNCPGQIVLSGEKEAIFKAVEASKNLGFKLVKPLNVAGAYHSKLMKSAKDSFSSFIKDYEFLKPKYRTFNNVSAEYLSDADKIKESLCDQIVSSVKFSDCILNSIDNGVDTFIECGPNKILSGLVRRTDKSIKVISISEYSDLEIVI